MLRFLAQIPTTKTSTPTGPVVGSGVTTRDWIVAGVLLVGSVVIGFLLERVLRRVIHRGDADHGMARFAGRLVRNVVILIGVVYALLTLDVRLTPLLGALGIGGLAVAFAAQSILENTFASLLLRTRRPFRRGDQITTGSYDGTVVEVNYRTVVLRTFDGMRVLIPCSQVLGNPIVNHTVTGARRTTFEVGVSYDADLEEAQRVLVDAVSSVESVRRTPPPEALVSSFDDSWVTISVRYWHPPEMATLWRTRSAVAIAVKRALDDAGIDMPSPTFDLRVASAPIGATTTQHSSGQAARGVVDSSEERRDEHARG